MKLSRILRESFLNESDELEILLQAKKIMSSYGIKTKTTDVKTSRDNTDFRTMTLSADSDFGFPLYVIISIVNGTFFSCVVEFPNPRAVKDKKNDDYKKSQKCSKEIIEFVTKRFPQATIVNNFLCNYFSGRTNSKFFNMANHYKAEERKAEKAVEKSVKRNEKKSFPPVATTQDVTVKMAEEAVKKLVQMEAERIRNMMKLWGTDTMSATVH